MTEKEKLAILLIKVFQGIDTKEVQQIGRGWLEKAEALLSLINQTYVRKDTKVRITCFHADVKCAGYVIKAIAELIGEEG